MTKIDLKKDLKQFYTASPHRVAIVEVPPLPFLMAQGQGDPNTSSAFQQATETLFRLPYTLKFMLKKEQGPDYVVMPLECLWWADDLTAFTEDRRDEWQWTAMILQPDFITREAMARAIDLAKTKKSDTPLYATTFGRHTDGQSAQILHLGPYPEAPVTIARLLGFIREKGYHLAGKHHEIYLSDPRRTAPGKLKTIIRQPITLEAQR
jgi:hypothetical protein